MSYLHLKNRDLEWSLNRASDGNFSEALQSLKPNFLTRVLSIVELKFPSADSDLELSATIKMDDLELVDWNPDQWNLLNECPPPQDGLFMVNYFEEDDEHYPYERHDVVTVHKYSTNPNNIIYYSMFSNREVHYSLDYSCDINDSCNSIFFKKWK